MDQRDERRGPGETARVPGRTLNSRRIGALPILEGFLKRLRLEELLRDHLPREDRRSRVSTAAALLVLTRNLLISREPLLRSLDFTAVVTVPLQAAEHDNLAAKRSVSLADVVRLQPRRPSEERP